MSTTQADAKKAFKSLNSPIYESRIPYAYDVGISCLPSANQAEWRKSGKYCPEAFTDCSSSLVPNIQQAIVLRNISLPRIVTLSLPISSITLTYDPNNNWYKLPQKTATISIHSSKVPSAKIWSESGVNMSLGPAIKQSKVSDSNKVQYDFILTVQQQTFITADAIQLKNNGVSAQLVVTAGDYSASRVYNISVNADLVPEFLTKDGNTLTLTSEGNEKFSLNDKFKITVQSVGDSQTITVNSITPNVPVISSTVSKSIFNSLFDANGFAQFDTTITLSASDITNDQADAIVSSGIELDITASSNGLSSSKTYRLKVAKPNT